MCLHFVSVPFLVLLRFLCLFILMLLTSEALTTSSDEILCAQPIQQQQQQALFSAHIYKHTVRAV